MAAAVITALVGVPHAQSLAVPPVVSAPPVAMPPAPIVPPPTAVHAPMSSPNPGPAAKSGGSLKVMLGGLGMLAIAGIVGAVTFIMLQRFQTAQTSNLPGDNGGPTKLPEINGSWVLWAQLLGVTAFLAGSIWGTVILARVMRRRKLEKRRRKLQEQSVLPESAETVPEAPPAPPAIVSDTVDCTVYAPSQAARGTALMVQVFAHLAEDVGLVRQLAQRFDATAQERGFTSLAVAVARGARLDMHLALPGLTIENPVASLIWRGTPNSVQFGVYVPPEQDLGTIIGTVTVSLGGVPLGHIKFKLDIIAAAAALPPVAQPVGHSHAYRRAFVSFAESDRDEAARRVQVLAGAKIDVKPLNWEAERQNESMRQALIDDSDLFLLCWSDAARKSPQVRQELEYALQRKQGQDSALPEILPVPLQGPPVPAPPLELSYLHFEDYLPYGKSNASSSSAPTILTSGQGFVTAPALADVRGQLVKGRYEVGELLGSGGFGAAYRAADISLARRAVVVKVLHQEGLRNTWAVQKFRHEIEALARLNHPGVVGIFDAGQLPDERPFLVLQHVEGQTLRNMLGPAGLPLGEVSDIIRQSGDALAEAHHKGILHRDLKPENIMLRQLSNGALHVVVIDFGIAKVRNAIMAPVTEGEHVSGTYLYMSPEQLLGEPLNAASDIFALGVIAYELVTGQRPFNPSAIGQLPAFHRQGAAALPCALRPELPPAAQLVMLKALAYRAAERYQNASVFGQELAQALQIEAT